MERVGFVGVGVMGGEMAAYMIQNGVPVLAYDKNPAVLAAMQARGADVAHSTREVADQTEIVFACLPTPEICRAVALGDDGIATGAKVKIYIETSTLGGAGAIEIAEGLKARGISFIDAPVVGGVVAVKANKLGVLAAGPSAAVERARFALKALGGRLFHLGEQAGMGQAGKVMNNAITYAAMMATCEAISIGMKAGLDMHTAVDIINQGSGSTFWSQIVFPNMYLKDIYTGTGAIEIGVKDVQLFIKEAQRLKVETPMATAVSALQARVAAAGEASRDTLEVMHFFTDLAGLPRGKQS